MNSNSTSTSYPRISIIVPSFNAEATIGRAVDSLIQQQYPDLEIICIDGASRDATVEVLRGYGPAISYLLSEPDRNSAEAINKGLRRATGELVGWLGADDELAPGALFAFAALFAANPHADVITGGCLRFYADGSQAVTAPVAGLERYISMKNGIEQPSTLWTRALQSRVGELDTSFRMAFDHDLWCRFAQAGAKFVVTDKVLSHYHFSESNLTSVGGRKLVGEMFRLTKKYGPHHGMLAYVYYFLYVVFDLRGYFDAAASIAPWKRRMFDRVMRGLRRMFGESCINNYNWNFASKQERGLCWYK